MTATRKKYIAAVAAGSAYLAVANDVSSRDHDATLLEAYKRVGRRVWPTRLPHGTVVELGGEQIPAGEPAAASASAIDGAPTRGLNAARQVDEVLR